MLQSDELYIAVCDDRSDDLTQITEMTSEILSQEQILYHIEAYQTSTALLSDIQNGRAFHLLLLDVMMDDLNGIQLAAALRHQNNGTQIIFISSNREMAMDGYEVSAARYLAKPLNPAKLKEALLYCLRTQNTKKEILLSADNGVHRISLPDIQYVEAFDRGTRIVFGDRTLEIRMKFSEVEKVLPEKNFLRCHRAFVVNLRCVNFIQRYEFVLRSGAKVPIGQARYAEMKNRFMDYVTD